MSTSAEERPVDLVLLHGFTGSRQSFDSLIEYLPHDWTFRTPSLLGHGAKDPAPDVHSFEEEVERIARELQRGGFRRGPLLGYSLGSRVGLGLLTRHPELFSSAILVGVHPGLEHDSEREERRRSDAVWIERLKRDGLEAFCEAWEKNPLFASQRSLPEAVRTNQRSIRRGHTAPGLCRALEVLGLAQMPDYGPALRCLELPVVLATGERDEKFSRIAGSICATSPRLSWRSFPEAGHNLLLEAPRALADLVLETNHRHAP